MVVDLLQLIPLLIEKLVGIINSLGYAGIFLGMAIESSFFPFPSEFILPPAGVLIARGQMSFLIVFILALAGSLVGAFFNYFFALFLGRRALNKLINRYGKFLFLKSSHLEKSDEYFRNHGEITTFVGRLLPGIRQLISLPAGFSRMNLLRFSIYTSLGAGIWSLVLIFLGYLYGNNQGLIEQRLNILVLVTVFVLLLIVGIYIWIRKSKKNYSAIKITPL